MAVKKATKTPPHRTPSARREERIRLRVICRKPLPAHEYGAEFGLQDNSATSPWVIHAGTPRANGDVVFECECRVRPHPRTGAPSFLGDFVHGDAARRFLYLSWRPRNWRPGDPDPAAPGWVRRIKVHLSSITWSLIDEAVKGGALEAAVAGTSKDGGPACASIPLEGRGWSVTRAR